MKFSNKNSPREIALYDPNVSARVNDLNNSTTMSDKETVWFYIRRIEMISRKMDYFL